MPNTNKRIEETAKEIATISVDEFLDILSESFHPDNKWDKITNTANEFLFKAIVRESKKALSQHEEEMRKAIEELRRKNDPYDSRGDSVGISYNQALDDVLQTLNK